MVGAMLEFMAALQILLSAFFNDSGLESRASQMLRSLVGSMLLGMKIVAESLKAAGGAHPLQSKSRRILRVMMPSTPACFQAE